MQTDRRGTPQPLPYYLAAAATAHAQAMAHAAGALPHLPWDKALAADAQDLRTGFFDVAQASVERLRSMLAGIDAWQVAPAATPRVRNAIWRHGPARLLDGGGSGQTVLIVPSLINRSAILDLATGPSFLDALADGGLRPVLLDWGEPDATTSRLDLGDHVGRILVPALHFLAGHSGGRVGLLGYCMGGTLAIALASEAPFLVSRLAVIGAPWDFTALAGVAGHLREAIQKSGIDPFRQSLRLTGQTYGAIPGAFFQLLFAMLAPMQAVRKYTCLDKMKDPDARARFLAVEDWVNDGVPVAAPAAETLLADWYGLNATGLGRWQVNGRAIRLADTPCPALSIIGTKDHIVPPAVAARFGPADPEIASGHVGLVAGRAHSLVAGRVCDFLGQKDVS